MNKEFLKDEFNAVQAIKLVIMAVAGLGMIYVAGSILAKLDKIAYLLFIIGSNTQK